MAGGHISNDYVEHSLQDPIFDLLLGTMFGDIEEFEKQMLEPSAEVLEHAMAIGHQIAVVG
jgi:hypothetical protein